MKPNDLDAELDRLEQASERIATNLVELEIDSSRQLLETSRLTGASAESWSEASAALSDLWIWRDRLDGLLERAEKLRRNPRRADELHELLAGPSIELERSTVPLAERDLLAGPELTVCSTPDELLARMSGAFDRVKTVVARFGQAWETHTPRLTEARTILERARGLAAALGEADRSDLRDAESRVSELGRRLTADPLAVAPADLDQVIVMLRSAEHDLQVGLATRSELDQQLGEARTRLTRLRGLLDECRETHEELVLKISAPTGRATPAIPDDLPGELDEIAARVRAGAWREAHRRLEAWTGRTQTVLDEAGGTVRANRAPIEARNQLRALLEAYRAKAGRLGAIEDPELDRIFADAHEALYVAPTDLSLAAQLVRRYQEYLNGSRPAEEVLR